MVQTYKSISARQPPFVEGSAPTHKIGDKGNGIITDIVDEDRGDARIDHHNDGGLSEDLQEAVSKPVATIASQASSGTAIKEDSTIVPSLSGGTESVLGFWLYMLPELTSN